jgi:SAM-dependent methyltransferase
LNVDLKAYDTDKSPAFLANYEREVGHLYSKPITILELGVQHGGSLLLWRDLLPNAQIVGLDAKPVEVPDTTGRIHVYAGFQQDREVLDRIAREMAPDGFDVIIDDASHIGQYTAESFWHLFPRHLKPGGVYVLEDWPTGYWSRWVDGHVPKSVAIPEQGAVDIAEIKPHKLETVRRLVWSSTRSLAAKLEEKTPRVKAKIGYVYRKVDSASLTTRFPSHDYGMVGVVKQLLDVCAIDMINAQRVHHDPSTDVGPIASINVKPGQVFIHKTYDTRDQKTAVRQATDSTA